MITKEEEQQYHEAMDSFYNELDAKWNKAKEELKGLIHPKYFDFAENNDSFSSEGIVEIVETDERRSGYSKHRHCRIKGKEEKLYMHSTDEIESIYDKESQYEGEKVEYWVWQTTGFCEDDYSGFLLLPLLDGIRFWKVYYSC